MYLLVIIKILQNFKRFITSFPILPSPIIANIFPPSSLPIKIFLSHAPPFKDEQACGIDLDKAQIKAHVCSAADSVFPPGVLKIYKNF